MIEEHIRKTLKLLKPVTLQHVDKCNYLENKDNPKKVPGVEIQQVFLIIQRKKQINETQIKIFNKQRVFQITKSFYV